MKAFRKYKFFFFVFIFSLFIQPCSPTMAAPISLEGENFNGRYIGGNIEFLNEQKLFLQLSPNWNIDPVFTQKMLSGELHSDSIIKFDFMVLNQGYKAKLSFFQTPSKKGVVTWGINDILKKTVSDLFVQSPKSIFRLDFTPHSWWIRFTIINQSKTPVDLVLELDKHFYSSFDLFIPGKNGFTMKKGNFPQNLDQRELHYKTFAFNFTAAPGSNTCYARVDSWFRDIVPVRIWTKNGFFEHIQHNNALLGIFSGVFLCIFFYSIFIYFIVKDISYLYLSFMTISGLMLHLASSGFGFQFLWPENALTGFYVICLGLLFSFISFLLFCRSFINIKVIAPRTDRLILSLVALFSIAAIGTIFLPLDRIKPVLFITMMINDMYYLILIYPAVLAIKKNIRAGKFLMAGIFLYLISNLEWILSNLDIIPYHYIDYIHIKGLAFLLIMALGLADKINFMKKSLAQLNISLEEKVDLRTQKLMHTTRDLQIANEQLKEMDKIKTRFFSNVSHEIRTPLTLISAPLEALLNGSIGNVSKEGFSILKSMQRNTKRLLKLVNDLLDFSKIDAQKMVLKISPCNISSLVASCVSDIEPAALTNDIEVFFKDKTNGITISVDPLLFEKAVFNLLSNALKFNHHKGSIQVVLSLTKNSVKILVKNTGIGIPKDKQQIIFQRFLQVDSSSTRKYEGTGIGLALTKEIIEMHNGQILVESEPDKGARFTIILPFHLPEDLNSTSYQSISQDLAKPSKTILIVEDNPDMQDFLDKLLEKKYATLTAANGLLALDLMEKNHVDLILADLMMPGMDGYELILNVRSKKQYQDLPIMILTARADISDKLSGFDKGANDYLTKPFSPDELMARIRSQLKFKSLREQTIAKFDQKKTQKTITQQTKEKIDIVKAFIKENYAEQITRESLAYAVDMSPDHLGRTFLQQSGVKISSFLNQIRIDQAKILLKGTNKKIIDIAFEVGFESLRTFNKVFFSMVHDNPSSYRKGRGSNS